LLLGAIGGGPTFIGTAIGHAFTAEWLAVVFLTLAAGSILYVIVQLIGVASRSKRMDLLAYGLLIGLVAGFVTDAIVTPAGVGRPAPPSRRLTPNRCGYPIAR